MADFTFSTQLEFWDALKIVSTQSFWGFPLAKRVITMSALRFLNQPNEIFVHNQDNLYMSFHNCNIHIDSTKLGNPKFIDAYVNYPLFIIPSSKILSKVNWWCTFIYIHMITSHWRFYSMWIHIFFQLYLYNQFFCWLINIL